MENEDPFDVLQIRDALTVGDKRRTAHRQRIADLGRDLRAGNVLVIDALCRKPGKNKVEGGDQVEQVGVPDIVLHDDAQFGQVILQRGRAEITIYVKFQRNLQVPA